MKFNDHSLNENARQPLFFSFESMNWKLNKYVPAGAKLGMNYL